MLVVQLDEEPPALGRHPVQFAVVRPGSDGGDQGARYRPAGFGQRGYRGHVTWAGGEQFEAASGQGMPIQGAVRWP